MNDIAETIARLSIFQKAALLSGANTWQTREIPDAGIPALWMADGPHGVRKQAGSADHLGINGSQPATCFPTAATIANSWDVDLAEEIGRALGREAAEQEVDVLLGPGLNIKRSPLGGRNFEYFSEDPELAGRLAAAYVRGIQGAGVAASPKHFAVNSQELRRMVSDSVVDDRTLHEIYLTAFEIVVRESSPWTVMSSYNLVNGTYAHENAELLSDVLRAQWGFDGAVVSDWGGADDAVRAVRAGGTIEMPSPGFGSAREIERAVLDGTLAEELLDERVAEVLTLVRRTRARAEAHAVDADAHDALARRAAAQSAVLLRNDDDILPLASATRVALIGDFARNPRYQGAGSSLVNATRVTSLVDAVDASALELAAVAAGFRRDGSPDAGLLAEAEVAARGADVVLLSIGLPESAESEGIDRTTLALPANQRELVSRVLAANPRTVVIVSAGGVVELAEAADAPAVLHGYLGGQAGAAGIVDVLTGVVEPGGRLAETVPVALGATPTAGRFPSTARTAEYREGLHVGYRAYDAADAPVAFPFGYGLGYTSFALSALSTDRAGATVTVTNTGPRRGADVVQAYVGRSGPSRVARLPRELKAFARVELDPGESREVFLPWNDRTFRHYDVDAGGWRTESGDFEVVVGRHSRDRGLSSIVRIEGDLDAPAADAPDAPATPVRAMDDDAFAAALGRTIPPTSRGRGPLGINDPIDDIRHARSRVARGVYRIVDRRRRRAESAGRPDLNMLFMLNAPFRVLSKMSGGLATSELVDGVLVAVNGRTFRGLGAVVVAFVRGRRLERDSRRRFAEPVHAHARRTTEGVQ